LLSYQRYNYRNDASWLKNHLDLAFSADEVASFRNMEDPAIMGDCVQIGESFADRYIDASHFPEAFDVPGNS